MKLENLEAKMHDLPTLPLVAQQINIESQDENFTAQSLGAIIEKDPSLTSKVLRLANSAYYGFSRQVTTIDRAVVLLGSNTIKNLALTVAVFKVFSAHEDPPIDLKGFWDHCLGCGVGAKAIMRIKDTTLAENAFLCGIIHDIGIILMINAFPEQMVEALGLIAKLDIAQCEAEKKIFSFTHQEAGALLSEKWNFPQVYFKAIRLHHAAPPRKLDGLDQDSLMQYAVYAGNHMAKAMGLGKSLDPRSAGIPSHVWEILGVSTNMLKELRATVKDEFEQIIKVWR